VLFDLLTAEHTFRKNTGFRGTFHFVDHTLAHAAHAFYDSGFQEAAILTLDGTGETKTCWIGESNGDKFIEHRSVLWPHSLGHVYAAITEYLGYESFKEEGLVMQLSQEGVPEHLEKFRKIIQDKDELFEIDLSYFGYPYSQPQRFSSRLAKEFGPARLPTEAVNERHKNIAASLQARLEEIVLKLARYAVRTSGKSALCLAGGVMHNSLAVEKLRQSGIAENIHVPSHPGDIGTALGAALLLHHAHHEV
jgi:carbamoyltransferase